jgi:hypothetical protein
VNYCSNVKAGLSSVDSITTLPVYNMFGDKLGRMFFVKLAQIMLF